MIKFNFYKFKELSLDQLYAILALRAEIFVVDQKCFYLDPDGKDSSAIHLLGEENNQILAYTRILSPMDKQVSFGRVVAAKSARGKGYGKLLMQELLAYCQSHYPNLSVQCSAQFYLKEFYESFGFVAKGDIYNNANIAHITMELK